MIQYISTFNDKYSKFINAVNRLEEALEECESNQTQLLRDGVIHRFEFCTELAWKTAREYLLDQGYIDINSPKSVMKLAYADGLIDDELSWIALLNSRNQTAHIYDENTACVIFENIRDKYLSLFQKLINKLNK